MRGELSKLILSYSDPLRIILTNIILYKEYYYTSSLLYTKYYIDLLNDIEFLYKLVNKYRYAYIYTTIKYKLIAQNHHQCVRYLLNTDILKTSIHAAILYKCDKNSIYSGKIADFIISIRLNTNFYNRVLETLYAFGGNVDMISFKPRHISNKTLFALMVLGENAKAIDHYVKLGGKLYTNDPEEHEHINILIKLRGLNIFKILYDKYNYIPLGKRIHCAVYNNASIDDLKWWLSITTGYIHVPELIVYLTKRKINHLFDVKFLENRCVQTINVFDE